jgi:hypothetical protein
MIKADLSSIASANDDMPRLGAMKRPNALHPSLMTPAERRSELCAILGLGIVRLHLRSRGQLSPESGDFPLHFTPEQSGSAAPTRRRAA